VSGPGNFLVLGINPPLSSLVLLPISYLGALSPIITSTLYAPGPGVSSIYSLAFLLVIYQPRDD